MSLHETKNTNFRWILGICTAVALVMITLWTLRFQMNPSFYGRSAFWNDKYYAPSDADGVVLGDSRAAYAVVPDEIEKSLPGKQKVFNFAFFSTGYCYHYLNTARAKLSEKSQNKFILVTIGPFNFMKDACVRGFFYYLSPETSAPISPMERFSNSVSHTLRSFSTDELLAIFTGAPSEDLTFMPQGWIRVKTIPSRVNPPIPKENWRLWQKKVSQDVVQEFSNWLKHTVRQGIKVYAIRTQLPQESKEFENTISGFDENQIRSIVESAGGHWIERLDFEPVTLDGLHMTEKSAREWSAWIGQHIK